LLAPVDAASAHIQRQHPAAGPPSSGLYTPQRGAGPSAAWRPASVGSGGAPAAGRHALEPPGVGPGRRSQAAPESHQPTTAGPQRARSASVGRLRRQSPPAPPTAAAPPAQPLRSAVPGVPRRRAHSLDPVWWDGRELQQPPWNFRGRAATAGSAQVGGKLAATARPAQEGNHRHQFVVAAQSGSGDLGLAGDGSGSPMLVTESRPPRRHVRVEPTRGGLVTSRADTWGAWFGFPTPATTQRQRTPLRVGGSAHARNPHRHPAPSGRHRGATWDWDRHLAGNSLAAGVGPWLGAPFSDDSIVRGESGDFSSVFVGAGLNSADLTRGEEGPAVGWGSVPGGYVPPTATAPGNEASMADASAALSCGNGSGVAFAVDGDDLGGGSSHRLPGVPIVDTPVVGSHGSLLPEGLPGSAVAPSTLASRLDVVTFTLGSGTGVSVGSPWRSAGLPPVVEVDQPGAARLAPRPRSQTRGRPIAASCPDVDAAPPTERSGTGSSGPLSRAHSAVSAQVAPSGARWCAVKHGVGGDSCQARPACDVERRSPWMLAWFVQVMMAAAQCDPQCLPGPTHAQWRTKAWPEPPSVLARVPPQCLRCVAQRTATAVLKPLMQDALWTSVAQFRQIRVPLGPALLVAFTRLLLLLLLLHPFLR
jgi:hypothetical protein